MQSIPGETLFGCFVTTLNSAFETELPQKDKGYESESESFNIPIPLKEYCESTMFQQWRIYPLTLQTLVNHQLHQSIMKRTHLKDTGITAPHTTD